jgi:hypothetical protein
MKKVVRLTESDLVNIVKRVISEQTSGKFDDQVLKFTKDVASKLVGKQICAEENDDSSNYECYFLDSVKEGPVYMNYDTNAKNVKDIKFINMSFRGRFYPSKPGSNIMKMSLDIGINLENGVPVSVSRTFVFPEKGGELIRLNDEEVTKKTIPLIKNIRVAEPPKVANPCFKGYKWGKHEYMRGPKHFTGQAFTKENSDGSETFLFKTGSDWSRGNGVIDKGEVKNSIQQIYWVCSSGKLTITNKIPTRD